jgi:hypothetical protein
MRFGVLFEVAVLHDYWLNLSAVVHEALPLERRRVLERQHSSSRYLELVPTATTRRMLAGHGMLFKTLSTGFLVGVELDNLTTVPMRPLEPNGVLTFALRVLDPRFFNYTAGVWPRFYRFSNTTGNEHAGALFLSQPVPSHQAARRYTAGEIRTVVNAGITGLFQATTDTGPSLTPVAADWQAIPADTYDPAATYQQDAIVLQGNELFRALVNSPGTDLDDATQWSNEGSLANQYVTGADELRLRPEVFSVDVAMASATVLELRVSRPGAVAPVWQRRFESSQILTSVQADLRGLADGTYRLDVLSSALISLPGLGFDFYLSTHGVAEAWFGVIDIHPGAGNFALLDGGNQLRSPRFELRFLNQASRWRYRFPRTQPIGVGAEVIVDPIDDSVLVTPSPRPLTRVGNGVRLRADDPATSAVSEQVLLPQPDARVLRKQDSQWFSEVHLSNFPTSS